VVINILKLEVIKLIIIKLNRKTKTNVKAHFKISYKINTRGGYTKFALLK